MTEVGLQSLALDGVRDSGVITTRDGTSEWVNPAFTALTGFARDRAVTLATSEGFSGHYAGTSHSIGVAVLAGEGTAMERGYQQASARPARDPTRAEEIGRGGGRRGGPPCASSGGASG